LLREGKIDAGLQPLPLNYEAEAEGFGNLGFAAKYEPDWQFTTVNANSDWARQHPQLVERFLRALIRGQDFIATHPEEAARIAATELKTPLPLAARSLADSLRLGILHPRLDWSEAGLKRIFENMQADGAIPSQQPFELGKVTDASYLRRAQAAVGGK
jgi:ABC-type nitrate/sulfonate/bicarbonate transport system substrate-binding protein